jgi:restriction system protein
MPKEFKDYPPSRQSAIKTVFAAMQLLKEAGGHLPGKEVIKKIPSKINLSEWEKQRYEKTGYVRWESILHFYTIDCIKAGFLYKQKGIWYLTEEGEKALKLGQVRLHEEASSKYREWASVNIKKDKNDDQQDSENILVEGEQAQKANLIQLEEQANEGIINHIRGKNPYEFQDLVAALLRSMGYHTPFIAPKGKDGGIDIFAFNDPLGATTPRIKVQVKHRPDATIGEDDIRKLVGLINKDGDIGLFVTSGYFSNDAERFSRSSHVHIRLIDIDQFISFWRQFYNKLTDDEKNLLPLQAIYFLGSNK